MSIVACCRRCGREYTADRTAILAGPLTWRLCPACRAPTPPSGGAVGGPNPRPLPAGADPVPA